MGRIYRSRTAHSILAEHNRQLKVLASASRLARSGLSVPAEGVTQVDGDLVVLGTFTAEGKISNEALVNPVRGDVTRGWATNFALTTTMTALAEQAWTVPAGFTQVAVSISAKVFAVNPTAGLDYVYAQAQISRDSDGAVIDGIATPTAVSASGGSGTSVGLGVAVMGLGDEDVVRVRVLGRTGFASWAASASNVAEVTGSLTWYRT